MHTMSKTAVFLIIVILGGFFYFYPRLTHVEPLVCTGAPIMCSDGSYISPTGPACTYAECPKVELPKQETTASLNQHIYNNGIYITPIEVLADSRCPEDVTCIWAGEVSLRVLLEKGTTTSEMTLKSQTAATFDGYAITLNDVIPANNSKTPFNKTDYKFIFAVAPLPL